MRLIDADALITAIKGKTIMSGMAKAMALDAIGQAPTIGQWISVKDALPNLHVRVLTCDEAHIVMENCLIEPAPFAKWAEGFYVNYWMPMPRPPRDDGGR